ncbi:MAG: phosphoribosylformylglycinamidine synthase subunit PurL, partial [SAR324 cluster bacterium]|nr:phosphoribosylformylglycinamidine synthase subunit PurL [SAR324 cluster bacterium]
NSLRFGPLKAGQKRDIPIVKRNRYLFGGVVSGIAGYGNCIGVPTVAGEVGFDACYSGNPLVNAMCVGVVRHEDLQHGRAEGIGNPVIYVGAATGRDGIHGATFASEELNEKSEAKRPAVQVGDPFMGKLVLEACLELFQCGAVISVQDMGAAGLTCSSTEMAEKGGNGMELDLDLVPQRALEMSPYEIMLSESQERMLLVAKEGREEEVFHICRKWEVPACTVGRVVSEPVLRLLHHGHSVAELPLDRLLGSCPFYEREAVPSKLQLERQKQDAVTWDLPQDLGALLKEMIIQPELASKRWVYGQYDSMVRTCTSVGPGSDAAVIRIDGTEKALAMSIDGNSRYVQLDPKTGGRIAVAEAARNVVCSGGSPLALTNGLNFGNPEKPEIFWQLREAVTGICEACESLKLPVTGGNVSLYNETNREAVYPTPLIGVVGLVDHPDHETTQHLKQAGDVLLLLGETEEELGGSALQQFQTGSIFGMPPSLNLEKEKTLQNAVLNAIQQHLIASAHDLSHGGLALALLTCCSGELGVHVDLELGIREDLALFSETQSRILLTVAPQNLQQVEMLMQAENVPCERIGVVMPGRFDVALNGRFVIQEELPGLRELWENALESIMSSEDHVISSSPLAA